MKNNLISHLSDDASNLNDRLNMIKKQIIEQNNDDEAKKLCTLLDELNEFELGQFLIKHEGLNGHWTHEIVTWDQHNPKRLLKNELETALFEKIPATLATQQRFKIFQEQLQFLLDENKVFASIPSGYMSELLCIDSEKLKDVQLIGIDLDVNAIHGAKQLAKQFNLEKNLTLIQEDAWNLSYQNEFDVITSNGLNIYEYDDARVEKLYTIFYNALKDNGTLITSFLTPPPTLSTSSPWKMQNLDLSALQLQKVIFIDILKAKWSAYRDIEVTQTQLMNAGFKDIQIINDEAGLFPTVVAKKS